MARLAGAAVAMNQWQAQCEVTRVVSGSDKRESRTKAFTRAAKALERKGAVCTSGNHIWPVTMPTLATDFEPFEDTVPSEDDL